jgi:hypothetical protein
VLDNEAAALKKGLLRYMFFIVFSDLKTVAPRQIAAQKCEFRLSRSFYVAMEVACFILISFR